MANTTSLATKVSVYTSSFSVGTKSSNYTLVVNAATGAPVSLTFVGYDRLFGSHYDKYIITYSDFSTDPPEPSTFDVPDGKTALNGLINYSYTCSVWQMSVHLLIMLVTMFYTLETCVDMVMYTSIHVYLR